MFFTSVVAAALLCVDTALLCCTPQCLHEQQLRHLTTGGALGVSRGSAKPRAKIRRAWQDQQQGRRQGQTSINSVALHFIRIFIYIYIFLSVCTYAHARVFEFQIFSLKRDWRMMHDFQPTPYRFCGGKWWDLGFVLMDAYQTSRRCSGKGMMTINPVLLSERVFIILRLFMLAAITCTQNVEKVQRAAAHETRGVDTCMCWPYY